MSSNQLSEKTEVEERPLTEEDLQKISSQAKNGKFLIYIAAFISILTFFCIKDGSWVGAVILGGLAVLFWYSSISSILSARKSKTKGTKKVERGIIFDLKETFEIQISTKKEKSAEGDRKLEILLGGKWHEVSNVNCDYWTDTPIFLKKEEKNFRVGDLIELSSSESGLNLGLEVIKAGELPEEGVLTRRIESSVRITSFDPRAIDLCSEKNAKHYYWQVNEEWIEVDEGLFSRSRCGEKVDASLGLKVMRSDSKP